MIDRKILSRLQNSSVTKSLEGICRNDNNFIKHYVELRGIFLIFPAKFLLKYSLEILAE